VIAPPQPSPVFESFIVSFGFAAGVGLGVVPVLLADAWGLRLGAMFLGSILLFGLIGFAVGSAGAGVNIGILCNLLIFAYILFEKPEYRVTERGALCRTITFWFVCLSFIAPADPDSLFRGRDIWWALAVPIAATVLVALPLILKDSWSWARRPIFFWNGLAAAYSALVCNRALIGAVIGDGDMPRPYIFLQAMLGGLAFMSAATDGAAVVGFLAWDTAPDEKDRKEIARIAAEAAQRLDEVTHEYGPGRLNMLLIAAVQTAILAANWKARFLPQSIPLNLSLAVLPYLVRYTASPAAPAAAKRKVLLGAKQL
jgi:hypothetical protein